MISVIMKLRPYAKGATKWLVLNLITAIVGNLFILVNPLLIGKLIGTLITGQVDFSLVSKYLIVIVSCYGLGSVVLWLSQVFANNYATMVTKNLRNETFHVLTHTNIKYIDSVQTGDIMNRFSQDIDLVYDALAHFFMHFFQGVTTIVFAFSVMIYLNVWLTLVVVAVVPLIFLYARITNKSRSERFLVLQRLTGDLSAYTTERFNDRKTIKAYNYEEKVKDEYQQINESLTSVATKAYFQASINNPTYRLFNNISYALMGLVAVLIVIWGGNIDVAILTSMIMYSQIFQRPFNDYSVLTANFMAGKAGVNRIMELISANVEIDKIKYNANDRAKQGIIKFNKVYFAYDKKIPVIANFSLEINAGMKVAIVGETGSGKTTLINLLMRFYDLQSGEIYLDGKNIVDYNRKALRQSFGLVLQDPWLFSGSILENLRYGRSKATLDEVIAAAKKANVHQFIVNLKDGYDTIIDESINFSTGQKQLLTIARALITNPAILILDEATSDIDSLMEYEVVKTFKEVMIGKTSFIIAHRLNTIVDSDLIIVMKNGEIVETGSHLELLNRKGHYQRLYVSQFATNKEL